MKLIIKNMVCKRCILIVRKLLEEMQLHADSITIGEAQLRESLSEMETVMLDRKLREQGFEILDDRKKILIERVKNTIIEIIHNVEGIHLRTNFSVLIAQATLTDYNTVSTLFSSQEGITIEQYIILQRIERVKELLAYDELNLGEIAETLGYSSLQHLSTQFKKVTGLTPTAFKKVKDRKRSALDTVKAGH
jgi:AraC family transcriptional regulator